MFQTALFTRVFLYIILYRHQKNTWSTQSSGQTGFQHTGARRKGSQCCGGFNDWWHVMDTFVVSSKNLQTQEKQKTQKRKKHTVYTRKRSFFAKNVRWCKCASFPSACFWRSRRSRMRSRMWVRSAGWVCAQFMLDISHSPVFMDI